MPERHPTVVPAQPRVAAPNSPSAILLRMYEVRRALREVASEARSVRRGGR
jgi:hypothetical protein